MTILVTGAAGFIGSNFVIDWFRQYSEDIVSLDLLTYAGNRKNLSCIDNHPNHHFFQGNISDSKLLDQLLTKYRIRAIIHFAAESHVDRSIHGSEDFIQTNIVGTYRLLESAKLYWQNLDQASKETFRFLHVSTDEVYGSLNECEPAFTEKHRYNPSSPYSSSKASSDLMVHAWFRTYGLPVLITNCSNNYGPYQFPEKLIPLCILNALKGKSLPIYGDGKQIRDWLYVKDHCSAIHRVLDYGRVGEIYNIGGLNEKTNIEVVRSICAILDQLKPKSNGKNYFDQIMFVKDRPGHDQRYAIDSTKLRNELNWSPQETFESGLQKTVIWYLENQDWTEQILTGEYQKWINKQYP
jgi:dTDP-glucose 4,6-dehydratase